MVGQHSANLKIPECRFFTPFFDRELRNLSTLVQNRVEVCPLFLIRNYKYMPDVSKEEILLHILTIYLSLNKIKCTIVSYQYELEITKYKWRPNWQAWFRISSIIYFSLSVYYIKQFPLLTTLQIFKIKFVNIVCIFALLHFL